MTQDWLYEDGEDASKAQYIAKMDEIRFVAGPVIQRYNDKVEEERQERLRLEQEEAAKRRAQNEALKKETEAKKAAEKPAEPQDRRRRGGEVEIRHLRPCLTYHA